MSDEYRKGNRLTPHDEDEEFDWKKTELVEDDIYYVIYPNQSYNSDMKQRITKDLGFRWVLTHWERREPFTKQQIDDLLIDGIVVEKR